jgi:hypothetical protein
VSVKWPVRLQTTSSWTGDHTRSPARPAPSDPALSLPFICPPNPRLTREGQVLGGFDYLWVCINWRAHRHGGAAGRRTGQPRPTRERGERDSGADLGRAAIAGCHVSASDDDRRGLQLATSRRRSVCRASKTPPCGCGARPRPSRRAPPRRPSPRVNRRGRAHIPAEPKRS